MPDFDCIIIGAGSAGSVLANRVSAAGVNAEAPQGIAGISLLALTGCRSGEIINLKWEEVDEEGSCLRLVESKEGASVRPAGQAVFEVLTQAEKKTDCPYRKIPRDIDEDARDVARAIVRTREYEQARHRRKKVEMLFAHLKSVLHLRRLRLRGPSGARDEFLLAAIAQNLRKLAKLRPTDMPPSLAVT